MARYIQVSLTNPIGTWVQKTNALQGYVGDLDDLNPNILTQVPGTDSSVVSVLNFLDSSVSQMQDSVNMEYMRLESGDFGLIRVDSGVFGYIHADSAYFDYAQIGSADITHLFFESGVGHHLKLRTLIVTGDSTGFDSNMSVRLPYGSIDSAEIHDSSIASRHLQNLTTTLILDSASVVLKTLYTPGR